MNFFSAIRSESTVAIRGSITKVARAKLMSALTERDKVVRPMTITVSGARSFAMVIEVRKRLACAFALGKVNGSSLKIGQPSCSANFATSSSAKPPRSCPITNKPRVDLLAKVPAFFRSNFLGGLTFKPSNQAVSALPISGSSNCTFKCTGPVCKAFSGSSNG